MVTLDRPVVFVDLETTGTSLSNDRIVQIAVLRCNHDLSIAEQHCMLLNPGIPIPEAASAAHHITDENVKDAPTFCEVAQDLHLFFEDADLGGYNIVEFDIPQLSKEFGNCGLPFPLPGTRFIDAFTIYQKWEPRNLAGAFKFYTGRQLEKAHDALADTLASLEIFKQQMALYDSLGSTTENIHQRCGFADGIDFAARLVRGPGGDIVFNFRKHKGFPFGEHRDYLQCMLGQDFPSQTKSIVKDILNGKLT
jgi:DNA polymerase III subunit epsilon